jgi:hypothetical protein
VRRQLKHLRYCGNTESIGQDDGVITLNPLVAAFAATKPRFTTLLDYYEKTHLVTSKTF